jgi:threonine dehydrogenase-like Zn-dependent dehydrogenase
MVVPENGVVKVREDAPLDKLSIMGCAVATGVGAVVNTAKVEAGSSVAVIGLGGVGLNVVQGAALAGAYPIIAVDVLERKLEMARQFGATHFVNAGKEDPEGGLRPHQRRRRLRLRGHRKAGGYQPGFRHGARGRRGDHGGRLAYGSKTSIDTNGLLAEKSLRAACTAPFGSGWTSPLRRPVHGGPPQADELVSRTFSGPDQRCLCRHEGRAR